MDSFMTAFPTNSHMYNNNDDNGCLILRHYPQGTVGAIYISGAYISCNRGVLQDIYICLRYIYALDIYICPPQGGYVNR